MVSKLMPSPMNFGTYGFLIVRKYTGSKGNNNCIGGSSRKTASVRPLLLSPELISPYIGIVNFISWCERIANKIVEKNVLVVYLNYFMADVTKMFSQKREIIMTHRHGNRINHYFTSAESFSWSRLKQQQGCNKL